MRTLLPSEPQFRLIGEIVRSGLILVMGLSVIAAGVVVLFYGG